MMKKLLVLMLVLGMASIANADLVFTIDGAPQPPEITIVVGELIELDLELSAGQDILRYLLRYQLSNEQATFVLPSPSSPPTFGVVFSGWDSTFPGKVDTYDDVGVMSWVEITADNFIGATDGPLTLMTDLYLECLETTDVVLTVTVAADASTVIDGSDVPGDTLLHTLTIHQVPEPATIALLGLGGLFLRRRRKSK